MRPWRWYPAMGSGPVEMGAYGAGTVFGEVALLDPGPASASVSATSASRTLALSRASLDELRASHPRVASAILHAFAHVLTERLRSGEAYLARLHKHEEPRRRSFMDALRGLLGLSS